jgi:hypothetical protein
VIIKVIFCGVRMVCSLQIDACKHAV